MSTKIIAQRDRVALVAGLTWTPLIRPVNKRTAEIRGHAAEAEASKVVLVTATARAAIGMYSEQEADHESSDADEKVVKPKQMYSLAAIFSSMVQDGNAVLALSVEGVSQAVVIVVGAGVPLIDEVTSPEKAQSLAMSYASGSEGFEYTLYTNDAQSFPAGQHLDIETLWAKVGKGSLLTARPANVMALAGVGAVLLAVGVASYGYLSWKEAAEKAERQRQAALADPTPQYVTALASSIGQMGLGPAEMLKLMNVVRSQKIWVDGWVLASVSCDVQQATCTSTWMRAGGTTDALVAARAPFGETPAGESDLNKVFMSFKVDLKPSGVGDRVDLPDQAAAVEADTPTYQIWENAGIKTAVAADGFKPWPVISGVDMAAVNADVIVKARPLEITVPSPIANEIVVSAPKTIFWSEVKFDVTPSSSATESLKVTLKGNSYVR